MSIPYKGTDIHIWDGSCTFQPGCTPFGFYDNDPEFQKAAVKVAHFCANRLGWPMMDVELQSGSFFTCFEEAVTIYGNTIYEFKVAENYLNLEGANADYDANSMVLEPSLQRIVEIAKNYGTEAGVGGNITMHTGFLEVQAGIQDYDLNKWAMDQGISGGIEIRRIFYEAPPAILRYFDPYAGTGTGIQSLMDAFDFGSYSPGVNFLLMPISHDLLQIQAIEFNDQVRKSAYSFQVINNMLRLFPIPSLTGRLRIEYYKLSDKKKLNANFSKYTSMSTIRKNFDVQVPNDGESCETVIFEHNLGTTEISVQTYETTPEGASLFIPYKVEILDPNRVAVSFGETTTGYIIIGYPDTEIVEKGIIKMRKTMHYDATTAPGIKRSVVLQHNLHTSDINVSIYDDSDGSPVQIIPDRVVVVDENTLSVSFLQSSRGFVVIGYPKLEDESAPTSIVTNVSEVPYTNPTFSKINSVGRQWIFEFTLALARELLAYVRGKYTSLPIPDSEATLNQSDLLTDARAEKESLIRQLREMLGEASRAKQLEKKALETENLEKTLRGVPMLIYIG